MSNPNPNPNPNSNPKPDPKPNPNPNPDQVANRLDVLPTAAQSAAKEAEAWFHRVSTRWRYLVITPRRRPGSTASAPGVRPGPNPDPGPNPNPDPNSDPDPNPDPDH
eukprot:scaffold90511_cov63-Phaeocystis_antarctica.AAC.1